MKHVLAVIILSALASGQSSPGSPAPPAENAPAKPSSLLPDLPPLPKGKTTVIGGTIRSLDRVRDQLTLRVFGSRQTMNILFDERTRVFRDGAPASPHDLRNEDHVSVETMLDGADVFARNIHILGHTTLGECSGQVLRYDRSRGELLIHDALSPEPVTLHVSSATAVRGQGQEPSGLSLTDLRAGTLVSAQFSPDGRGRSIATQLVILATPGTTFTFSGKVTFLDLHAGLLVLTDPRTNKTYEISFSQTRIPTSAQVHEGSDLIVTTSFDGTRYIASDIVAAPSPK